MHYDEQYWAPSGPRYQPWRMAAWRARVTFPQDAQRRRSAMACLGRLEDRPPRTNRASIASPEKPNHWERHGLDLPRLRDSAERVRLHVRPGAQELPWLF
jgi:hypothetical protein